MVADLSEWLPVVSVQSGNRLHRICKFAAISVVVPTTTVIISFHSSMIYAYLHSAKMEQCKYAIKIIPGSVNCWPCLFYA